MNANMSTNMRSLTCVARHVSMREIKEMTLRADIRSGFQQVFEEVVEVAVKAVNRQRTNDGNVIIGHI